jgi:hypothetical protein
MNRYIQPFSRSVKFFNNKALWFNLINKNSTPCEVEDNILLSRLKLVGASLRGGSCRERQVLEIYPYILLGVANSAAINNSFAVINNNQVTKG